MRIREPLNEKVQPQFAGDRGVWLPATGGSSQRNLTPSIVAGRCFAQLCLKSLEWTGRSTADPGNVIFSAIHDRKWNDPSAGEALERTFLSRSRSRNQKLLAPEEILPLVTSLAAAFCAQAIKAMDVADTSQAWAYAAKAEHWCGVAAGISFQKRTLRGKLISDFARKGASARHLNNRVMQKIVAVHYEQNIHAYQTIAAAAEAIAGTIVDAQFETVRRWIKRHRRIMREAGRL